MRMLPSAGTVPTAGLQPWGRILMLGGEDDGGRRVGEHLARRGYELRREARLAPGLELDAFDVVVLARPAAGEGALGQILELRARAARALLVLQAKADPNHAADVLDAGADDCLAAPHNPHEVAARVRALLRRRARAGAGGAARHVAFDGFVLDGERRRVVGPDGRSVTLTNAQQRLMLALLARPGQVVSRDELLDQVHGEDSACFDRAIDVHISRLKKRLSQVTESELITCYRGIGYRLQATRVRP